MTAIAGEILDRYDNFLKGKTKRVEMINEPGYTYPHLRWMIEEIRSGRVGGEKSHRWLGFIQGVLIREDHFKVNEERDFTRPFFRGRPEQEMDLISIDQHNAEVFRKHGNMKTGIGCTCGGEYQYVSNTVLLTSPGQKEVKCFDCGKEATVYV